MHLVSEYVVSTISKLISKYSKDFPKLLSANVGISVFFFGGDTGEELIKYSCFFAPSVTVTPLLSTRFPTYSLVLVFAWT